jgi:hypothetical protein
MINSHNLPSGWQLWRLAITGFRLHMWRYIFLVLVVIIPNQLINALAGGDSTVAVYTLIASLFMNGALIYAVIRFKAEPNSKPKLRELYYTSSAGLLRYIIVSLILAVMLIPAAFGLWLSGAGNSTMAAPALGEQLLLGLIGLIIAIPSIYLLIRNGLGSLIVYEGSVWPSEAIRRSRQVTKGHFWALLVRYLIMTLGLIVAIIPLTIICISLFLFTHIQFFITLNQIVNVTLLLPLFYLYTYELYSSLGTKNKPNHTEE